jgi:hypothetical protein
VHDEAVKTAKIRKWIIADATGGCHETRHQHRRCAVSNLQRCGGKLIAEAAMSAPKESHGVPVVVSLEPRQLAVSSETGRYPQNGFLLRDMTTSA